MSTVQPVGILPDIEIPGADALGRIFSVIGSEGFWKRAGVMVLGTILVIIGTVIAVSGTKAVKDTAQLVTGVASKVVTKGAV